jgi:deoxyribodipyrimidine photolyase-related protein
MVPNVYGMGLFADGGLFATKPYIAGGNYLQKMGDYSQPNQWASVWTEKFWQFLLQHQNYFSQNPRLNLLLQKKLNSTNSSQQ